MDLTQVLTALITSATTLAGIYLKGIIEKRTQNREVPDLSEPEIESIVTPILDTIRIETGAYRVGYWEGSNGVKTLSGFHIKKLSMFAESLGYDGDMHEARSIKEESQMLSLDMFSRSMNKLRTSTEHCLVSHEVDYDDFQAALHKRDGVETVIFIKVFTKFNKWTGLVTVYFTNKTEPSPSTLAWLQTQVGRIGNLVSK